MTGLLKQNLLLEMYNFNGGQPGKCVTRKGNLRLAGLGMLSLSRLNVYWIYKFKLLVLPQLNRQEEPPFNRKEKDLYKWKRFGKIFATANDMAQKCKNFSICSNWLQS